MPYLVEPPWARRVETGLRTLLYLFVLVMGFAAVFLTPLTVAGVVGVLTIKIAGWVLMVCSLSSLYGAFTRRYQFEWVSIWMIAGAFFSYLISVWALVDGETMTRLMQASAVSVAFLAILIRGVQLTVTAKKNRDAHRYFKVRG
jgi:hypothetical protein